ncbi:hypothetical protein [Sphingopyxis kveilinensis]|uniref:hypothetical protein n=1 Tax=Sphingopyxis kveilinensis TaxID=3114367 RepID=UPI0030CF9F98
MAEGEVAKQPPGDRNEAGVTLLVIGGYGAVGSRLCACLADVGFTVIPAGRRPAAAMAVAARCGTAARAIDLGVAASWDMACEGVDCVIVCMDQEDTAFVRYIFDHGITYIDITASDEFFREIEALAPNRSAALLSVGLAPGLTNILAAACAAQLDRVDRIDIGLLAGLGDHHGRAGLEWIADRIFDPARNRRGVPLAFGFGQGRRNAFEVNFSDQHSLRRTLGIDQVTTRLAFESRLATRLLFGFASLFAGSARARSALLYAVGALRFGRKTCNLSVHAAGQRAGQPAVASAHFAGEVESELTAQLAAIQIATFLQASPAPGVRHSHQLVRPDDVFAAIRQRRVGALTATF